MDKRLQKRIKSRILVKIDGKSAILSDYSETGMQIAASTSPTSKTVNITFTLADQVITMQGVIQWVKKRYSIQTAYQFGCRIDDPPPVYRAFLINH